MAIRYECDKDENIVYAYPSGLVSMSDISEYFQKLGEDPDVGNDFIEIANLEGVEEFNFSYSDALQLPNLFGELKNKKKHKGTILIGTKDFQFGMARMMSIISENDVTIRVVRSQEEAQKEVKALRA